MQGGPTSRPPVGSRPGRQPATGWTRGARLKSGLKPEGLSILLIALGDGVALEATAVPGLAENDAGWEALRHTLERLLD
jgi:hypothetical protein